MSSEQEKQQMFRMLAEGLLKHLMPTFQQVAQQVVQQGLQAGARSVPNHWVTPVAVRRLLDDETSQYETVQTTPAQMLFEGVDILDAIHDELIELNENFDKLSRGKGRRRT